MALMGVRDQTDVHWQALIYEANDTSATRLLRVCGDERTANHPFRKAPVVGCSFGYGSHSPQTKEGLKWFESHGVSRPMALTRDTTAHAYCWGLKFVAPARLLDYKLRRFAKYNFTQDAGDIELLSNWSAAADAAEAKLRHQQDELAVPDAPSRVCRGVSHVTFLNLRIPKAAGSSSGCTLSSVSEEAGGCLDADRCSWHATFTAHAPHDSHP